MYTDVVIVGGGPAGLSAAIAARLKGLRATVVDARRPAIDKPCGEGLLPQAVSALRSLGVPIESLPAYRFSGIRFSNRAGSVASTFGQASGYGVRRTVLHSALVERARELGVEMLWGKHVALDKDGCPEIDGTVRHCKWLVAADGLQSQLRRRVGLQPIVGAKGRFAFRRHYASEPWTDLVEVHWNGRQQMIVTPTDAREICIAFFTDDPRARIDQALAVFPEVAKRIAGAAAISAEAGCKTALCRARAVVQGNVALTGDAACAIDGIAGQGLSLAFAGAIVLADALAHQDLQKYAAAHRELARVPVSITRLLLLMARVPWIQRKALRLFAAQPAFFSEITALHSDQPGAGDFRLPDLCELGWQVLCA